MRARYAMYWACRSQRCNLLKDTVESFLATYVSLFVIRFWVLYVHFALMQNEPKNQNDLLGNYRRYHSLLHLCFSLYWTSSFNPWFSFRTVLFAHYFWKSLVPTLSEFQVVLLLWDVFYWAFLNCVSKNINYTVIASEVCDVLSLSK